MSSASTLVFDCFVHGIFRLDLCVFKHCLHVFFKYKATCFYVGFKCIARYKMLRILHEYESVYTGLEWLFVFDAWQYSISVIFYKIQQWHWHLSLKTAWENLNPSSRPAEILLEIAGYTTCRMTCFFFLFPL